MILVDITAPFKLTSTIDLKKLIGKKKLKIYDDTLFKDYYFLSLGEEGAYMFDLSDKNDIKIINKFDNIFFG